MLAALLGTAFSATGFNSTAFAAVATTQQKAPRVKAPRVKAPRPLPVPVLPPDAEPSDGQSARHPASTATVKAEKQITLEQRIRQVLEGSLLRNANSGVMVYDQTEQKTLVAIHEEQLFTSGSTTKLVTLGAALALLGEDYRFHTKVFRNGPVTEDGTLEGDLVLVASGDLNLSGRVLTGDRLDWEARDHAYAGSLPGKSVAGDPLRVMKLLAAGVLMKGIWRVRGHILVDASLFPSTQTEPATHTTISPAVLNDNVIDVIATSAEKEGGAVKLEMSPEVPSLRVINHVRTGKTDATADLHFDADTVEADGSHTVVLGGVLPAGRERAQAAYKVKDPVRYAAEGFREALRWAGIVVEPPLEKSLPAWVPEDAPDADANNAAENGAQDTEAHNGGPHPAPHHDEEFPQTSELVEHVSPPLAEEVRLTLKVSQNLHAATMPYLIGCIAGHPAAGSLGGDAAQRGLLLARRWLQKAGLEPEKVSQLDGEGGVGSAFSPKFMVRYLDFMSHQPYGKTFAAALPVLGRDGTLAEVLSDSAAAGHVRAKTGSYVVANNLGGGVMLLGKGLAGYIDAANGHRLVFAVFVNNLALRDMQEVGKVGETLAEISALAWQYAPPVAAAKPAPVALKATAKPTAKGSAATHAPAKSSAKKSTAHPAAKKAGHKALAATPD
jgi:D-alanyl-D-alanine carboxypeptidase/D-alanyl-D-alanine-endopeptidase (penicillin-binding protein 4)